MPRFTSLAPQLLVNDLAAAVDFYRKLGFDFDTWQDFYAIARRDGLELHLKAAPKNPEERRHRREELHLDTSIGVDGVEQYYQECVAAGVNITRPLTPTEWGTLDFYIEDPSGNLLCFGGRTNG